MKTKPLISWPGGKTRMLNHLLPHCSSNRGYIEAFAGGLALLLAKDPSKLEVVNDINGDLVTLYRVAKYHPEALAAEISGMPASRQFLDESNQLLKTTALTDIQRAALWIHANKTSFGANGTSFAVSKDPGTRPLISRDTLMARIAEFSKRMQHVLIESMDYKRLLKTYDHPGNLFFLDPPYLNADVKSYRGWTEHEMGQFQAAVLAIKGRWIVTVDDSSLNRALWKGHDITFVTTRNRAVNIGKAPDRTFGEMVIYSPGLRTRATASAKKAA